jgi:hypothetical protein
MHLGAHLVYQALHIGLPVSFGVPGAGVLEVCFETAADSLQPIRAERFAEEFARIAALLLRYLVNLFGEVLGKTLS